MPVTQLTSREFNPDTRRAKKAAEAGPVFVTDRGRASHVLTMADHEIRDRGAAGLTDGAHRFRLRQLIKAGSQQVRNIRLTAFTDSC